MCDPIRDIFRAYDEGHAALLVHGRSLYDLVVDDEGRIRPVLEAIRRYAGAKYGMHIVSYSLAQGLDWDATRVDDQRDRAAIEQALRTHGLVNVTQDQNEIVRVIRGIASLARAPKGTTRWADGRDLRFGFLLEFAEHLAPGSLTNGTQTDLQLVAIELAHIVGQSLALRSSGNVVIFHGRQGLVDHLVTNAIHSVRLRLPDRTEKERFVKAAMGVYPGASFADGLTSEHVAHLTTFTPNRGIEELLRDSHRAAHPLTAKALTAQKSRDVVALSEETMTVLDPGRVAGAKLLGRNISGPAAILRQLAGRLRAGDSRMPANVLLSGAPGGGKTDLAILTAEVAGVTAYALTSPKRGIVGETERLARLQQDLLAQFAPAVAFVDEITESLPMQRNDFDGDSGATRAVMATLLTALSDESRRGRSLLISTTNCPWRISAAMRSRLTLIPVLQPLKEDLPQIIAATALRVQAESNIQAADDRVIEAAAIFYGKGASPRHIREALTSALVYSDELTPDTVLHASRDLQGVADRVSSIYADLWAIRSCASRRFLPWYDAPEAYPFPDYLEGLVDTRTGDVLVPELDRRIKEYEPHANV